MEYKGIEFDAVIATPGCGKSYLADKDDRFVDVDEVRLRSKYIVPEDVTREELERTKGERTWTRIKDYKGIFADKLDEYVAQGKILIAAPHPESFDYFDSRGIKYCFVYPKGDTREAMKKRFELRNNPANFIKENDDAFDDFYISNRQDKRAVVHYEFGADEYLEGILKKFGVPFEEQQPSVMENV